MSRKITRENPNHRLLIVKIPIKITNCNVKKVTGKDKTRMYQYRHNQNVSASLELEQLKGIKYNDIIKNILNGTLNVYGSLRGVTFTNESKIIFTKVNPYQ